MSNFTFQNPTNSTFISSNSDLQEIWLMRNNVKKQLKDVEEKLDAARKTIYLPSKNEDDEISSFDVENSNRHCSFPIRTHYHVPTSPVSYDFEITPKRNKINFEKEQTSAKRKLPVDAFKHYGVTDEGLGEIRKDNVFNVTKPMSLREQAKFYTVQDFLRRENADLKHPPSSSQTSKEVVFDQLSEKLHEIKTQTGAIRREIAQNLYETSSKDAQKKPKTPRNESTIVENSLNIDKNLAEPTRTPRIFSQGNIPKAQLRKIESTSDRSVRSTSANVARVENIRRKYTTQEIETGKNQIKRSSSSHESSSVASSVPKGNPVRKQNSIESTTSSSSTSTPTSTSSQLTLSEDPKSQDDVKTLSNKSKTTSGPTSTTSSVPPNNPLANGGPSSSKVLEKFDAKQVVHLRKKANPLLEGISNAVKVRTYDAEEIRQYMAKKKKERKSAAEASKTNDKTNGSIEKSRHYDQDLMKEYIKQQKFQRKTDSQRAKEKMERAKMLQNEKMQQIFDAQRSVRNVPLIQLILNANNFDKRPLNVQNLSKEDLVQLIREKYQTDTFHDHVSQHSSQFQPVNGEKSSNETSFDDDIIAPKSMLDANGFFDGRTVERSTSAENLKLSEKSHRNGNVDEYNIINTILRKHPELRISSATRNEVKNHSLNDESRRSTRVPRLDLRIADQSNEIPSRHDASSSIVLPKRNSDRSSYFANGRVSSSENAESEPSSRPSASVSSLTLSTGGRPSTDNVPYDRKLRRSSSNEVKIQPDRTLINTSSESLSTNGRSISEEHLSPTALQMQATAGLNYLHFVQDSIRQVADVDRTNLLSTSQQNAAAYGQFAQAELANQQLHKDLQQVRLNTERQRMTLEAEKLIAEERRSIAAEMSENQRRLMDTIFETNQRMVDYRERNAEMLAKLATEVATTAATSAVLAAFKHQPSAALSTPQTTADGNHSKSSSTQTSISTDLDETNSELFTFPAKITANAHNGSVFPKIVVEPKSNASSTIPTVADEAQNDSSSTPISVETVADELKSVSSSKHSSVQTVADEAKTASSSTQTSAPTVADEAKTASSSTQTSVASIVDEAKANSSSTQTSIPTVADEARTNSSSQTSIATAIRTARSNSSITDEAESNPSSSSENSTVKGSVETKIESSSKDHSNSVEKTTPSSQSGVSKSSSSKRSSSNSQSADTSDSLRKVKEKVTKSPGGKTAKILHEFLRKNGSNVDEIQLSPSSLSISDMTEMESRIHALKTDLKERKDIAEKLKHEYKRRTKEGFKITEQSLTRQIQSYNHFIDQARLQLKDLERSNVVGSNLSSTRSSTPPRIMSPRNSDSEGPTPLSPRKKLKSVVSSPRSSSSNTSRANSEEKTPRETSSVHQVNSDKTSSVSTEKDFNAEDSSKEKTTINDEKLVSAREKESIKSDKINVPPLDIAEQNFDATKPVVVSSRKPSVDAETTEDVSDVPEDIEEEIVVDSEKTKTDSDSKTTENHSEVYSSVHETLTPKNEIGSPSEKDASKAFDTNHPTSLPLDTDDVSVDETNDEEVKKLSHESNSQRKERLLASVLNAFVVKSVDECIGLYKLKACQFQDASQLVKPEAKSSEDKFSFEKDPAEHLSKQIFDEFLADAIGSCVRIAISKREFASVGVISQKELGRVLELTKPTTPPERTPVSSNETSPRSSPRSPSIDKYVSEIYREPNQNRKNGGEKSPRSSEKVDVPPLDTDEMFNDESWMDDDFGLGDANDDALSPKKKNSPKSPRLDLSKFTTDVFSAVPCTAAQILEVVGCCVEKIYEQRRFGEPMSDAQKPKNLFAVGRTTDGALDLSITRDSDAAYRDFLFDYCKEIVCAIYANDSVSFGSTEDPLWKKPERLKLSQYSKVPPRNVDELKVIVNDIVKERLNLEVPTKTGREKIVARKKLDKIDEVLLPEMYREEPDWTNYDSEELKVKFELADSVWKTIIDEWSNEYLNILH